MFEDIPENKTKIFVTGPERSGTRITAHIISEILGLEYIDEGFPHCKAHNNWKETIISKDRFVLQCPRHACRCHHFCFDDSVMVVFCRRDIDEIIKSQKRIGWKASSDEIKRYKDNFPLYFKENEKLKDLHINELKYYVWDNLQKMVLPLDSWYDCEYKNLKNNPLFLTKENRKNFKWNQWNRSKER